MRVTGWVVLAALILAALPAAGAEKLPGGGVQSFRLPGDGPWDYVTFDAAHRRVFIGRYDGVQVVDVDTGRLNQTIGARGGDHGAVIAADLRLLFTSDAAAHQLGVYDLDTLAADAPVHLGGEPDGLVYDPASHRVLALLPHRHEIVAVDARTRHVAGRMDVGGEPEAGVADGHGAVFATLRDTGEVIRLDAGTLRIRARWSIGCARPRPVALNADGSRLFVGCGDARMLELDPASGRVLASATTGEGTDGLAFDPVGRRVVVSNGGGSLTLLGVRSDGVVPLGAIATPPGARTMALDSAAGRVFTVTADIARVQPPTAGRPYQRLIPKLGTFRLLVVPLPPR